MVNREKAGFCPGWDYVRDLGYLPKNPRGWPCPRHPFSHRESCRSWPWFSLALTPSWPTHSEWRGFEARCYYFVSNATRITTKSTPNGQQQASTEGRRGKFKKRKKKEAETAPPPLAVLISFTLRIHSTSLSARRSKVSETSTLLTSAMSLRAQVWTPVKPGWPASKNIKGNITCGPRYLKPLLCSHQRCQFVPKFGRL
jgi:hypothetical protein